MDKLENQKCEACQVGAPLVTNEEISRLLPAIAGWSIITEEGIRKLTKTFSFADFNEALTFTQSIGIIAAEENHHPKIVTEWGKVEVTWWTHKIRGLHRNDFIMAAKTDKLLLSRK